MVKANLSENQGVNILVSEQEKLFGNKLWTFIGESNFKDGKIKKKKMKQNLRILKLNLEIDRLRTSLEETRIRNLKLEIKSRKLFEKIKALNMIQSNQDLAEKWQKEIQELDTILEESEIDQDAGSDRSIERLFINASRESSLQTEELETKFTQNVGVKSKEKLLEPLGQTESEKNVQYLEILDKLSKLEMSVLEDQEKNHLFEDDNASENPWDFTEMLITSFEKKLIVLKSTLDLNVKAKSKYLNQRRLNLICNI